MAYVKRMVMQGFKSFAKKTEVHFDTGINVILGPNGSGKSNISDALCFVLGRLSIKSIRAAKARNLIFMGSKYVKPAKEAYVELVFDNTDKSFSIEKDEISLKRIVRYNGQSVYKINDETKTRSEVIELLAQAGIDPHGANIVLQGQIQSVVRMHPDERRKVIEEVAGIAIYETRKEKSLKELEKTDERLKEISTILRERTAFLKNLEREKAQAQRYKELESTVKRSKATILHKKREDKEKEVNSMIKSIEAKTKDKDKVREQGDKVKTELEGISWKIEEINKHIEKATGLEQENLHNEIANLRAEIEGLKVRKESYEHRRDEIERRISELGKGIPETELEIKELKLKSPLMAKKSESLRKKKEELAEIESERKKLLGVKTELNGLRERIRDKEGQVKRAELESENLLKQLEENSSDLKFRTEEEVSKKEGSWRKSLLDKREELEELNKKELENEKIIVLADSEIERAKEIRKKIEDIDTCPLCQTKMTEQHRAHVFKDTEENIDKFGKKKEISAKKLDEIKETRIKARKEIEGLEREISGAEIEIIKHRNIKEKKEQLKRVVEQEKILKKELEGLDERRKNLEVKSGDIGVIEERYDRKMLEMQEISSRNEDNLDTTIIYKERELENTRNIIKRAKEDFAEIGEQIDEIGDNLEKKIDELDEKEEQEGALNKRFKKMFEDRDSLQRKIQEGNMKMSEIQNEVRQVEDQVNYLKIGKAKLDAEKEAVELDMQEFIGVELLQGSIQSLEERLKKAQEILQTIGSINMRALEVYDEVKKEYDAVYVKVETLEKEKIEIMKIIEEIDKKKKKTFMRTFKALNELFSRNFSKLSTKGVAYLELQNKEDIFAGGVSIIVKLAKGKYFDVTSLSGGEQTLVALSLLFAVQEFRPYHFYIFDEIDAALDKRNSERLAGLLNQYMKSGQYIVITHNDAIIMNSNVLYGVSMQDGVSKVLSLKVS